MQAQEAIIEEEQQTGEIIKRERRWEGGIVYAAQQVVMKEKALVFMDDALADEREVHATLTKIIRGEPVGTIEASPKYENVLTACKILQDKFQEERRVSGAGRSSIILQMSQGTETSSASAGQISGPMKSQIEDSAVSALKQLTASIKNINAVDSVDPEEIARQNDTDGLLTLFNVESNADENKSDEEEEPF